jgi:hypothetical protein
VTKTTADTSTPRRGEAHGGQDQRGEREPGVRPPEVQAQRDAGAQIRREAHGGEREAGERRAQHGEGRARRADHDELERAGGLALAGAGGHRAHAVGHVAQQREPDDREAEVAGAVVAERASRRAAQRPRDEEEHEHAARRGGHPHGEAGPVGGLDPQASSSTE